MPIAPFMSFLAPLAASRIAFQSVTAIGHAVAVPIANASASFAELLSLGGAESQSTTHATDVDAVASASENPLAELANQIRDRVAELVNDVSEPLSGVVTIELSALGNVYCSGDSSQVCQLEPAIEADSELLGYLHKWLDLSGESEFHFDPKTVANATA